MLNLKAGSEPSFASTNIDILHVNLRAFVPHSAELLARLTLLNFPAPVAINEALLSKSVPCISLPKYDLVSRLDCRDGREGGGIALFVRSSFSKCVVLVKQSEIHKRLWIIVLTNHGPLLVGVWYRPLCAGETCSIATLESEWMDWKDQCIGTVIVGIVNVHHLAWLRHSSQTSAERRSLFQFCSSFGFIECCKEPTRQ